MTRTILLAPPPARHAALLAQLQAAVQRGWLRPLDQALAAFLAARAPDADPLLILGAALASHQLGRGHTCVDLPMAVADPLRVLGLSRDDSGCSGPDDPGEPGEPGAADGPFGPLVQLAPLAPSAPGPAPVAAAQPGSLAALLALARPLGPVRLADWQAALQHPVLVGTGPGSTPLVCAGTRLYLRRYWQHEQTVRQGIAARLAQPTEAAQSARQAELRRLLDALFPGPAPADDIDHQKLACALAARQGFAIVTGGPGTGKTTTVVRLLALLQQLALTGPQARALRIRLAAPTGKAAARLNASIANAVGQLPFDDAALRAAIPTQVTTVHRLLGSRPDSQRFRHDARSPLPLDVLVIDEASMLDLALMAAVLQALPPQARLILLGDKDQLASVEAGAVLGDLCDRADGGHYTPDTSAWLQAVTGQVVPADLQAPDGQPLDQAIAKLRRSHRFGQHSGIGRLAGAVNSGRPSEVADVWAQAPDGLHRLPAGDEAAFQRLVVEGGGDAAHGAHAARPAGYRHYLTVMRQAQPPADAPAQAWDVWAGQVLQAHGQFQLLCVLRRGPLGVDGLNTRIAQLLRNAGLLAPAAGDWYAGRPVLVTRNDPGLKLMNGDVGIALLRPGPDGQPQLRVAFPSAEAPGRAVGTSSAAGAGAGAGTSPAQPAIRWLLPSRLLAVDTVFAMTVHKSQGSEFDHAALVLPDRPNPVLTRELVYTAITRAKTHFTLLPAAGAAGLMAEAVRQRVWRQGGLVHAPLPVPMPATAPVPTPTPTPTPTPPAPQ